MDLIRERESCTSQISLFSCTDCVWFYMLAINDFSLYFLQIISLLCTNCFCMCMSAMNQGLFTLICHFWIFRGALMSRLNSICLSVSWRNSFRSQFLYQGVEITTYLIWPHDRICPYPYPWNCDSLFFVGLLGWLACWVRIQWWNAPKKWFWIWC